MPRRYATLARSMTLEVRSRFKCFWKKPASSPDIGSPGKSDPGHFRQSTLAAVRCSAAPGTDIFGPPSLLRKVTMNGHKTVRSGLDSIARVGNRR